MELPYFLLPELSRRLGREVTDDDHAIGLEYLGLTENEPDLEPNVKGLFEGYRQDYEFGSFVLQGQLDFLNASGPLHFKVSYAGLISPQFAKRFRPEARIRIEMLTWTAARHPRPRWRAIGNNLFSKAMMKEIQAQIVWRATRANEKYKA